MHYEEILTQVIALLQQEHRIAYRSTGLAARMQALATPGSILASGESFRLTEGYFAFRALGTAPVQGVREPVAMYEVLGVGPLRTRLQVAAHRGLVRFVGRQRELEQMQQALALAQGGRGQMVAIVGEPGVGKSRLCYEFKVQAQRHCQVLETFSVSHGKAYPYLPLIELLKNYFQLGPQDDPRRRREQVTGKVLTLERGLEDTLPYLLALLGDPESIAALAPMDPPLRRRRTFEAMTRVLLRESLAQPLLLLVEDLHWLDSEPVLWGLERYYLVRAEHQMAGELAEQLLSLAQQQGDPALLLEAHRALGQSLCWRGRVAEARAAVETTGERLWEAELHRLRGELLLQQTHSPLPEAETCLRQALDIAHRQGAKAYELRAAISLARLWQGRGKRAEARALLAEVYGWFTEGFETVDMREARALLDTIA